METKMQTFDIRSIDLIILFNELLELKKQNGLEAFEKRRAELIQNYFKTITDEKLRKYLGRKQLEIDFERVKYKGDKLGFASYLIGLLRESFVREVALRRDDIITETKEMIESKRNFYKVSYIRLPVLSKT